ncbi:amidohydrolase family protein [Pinibacter aurantiacus]|uniref:Amidohydrolase family protein n=1 Tax=Pinibacter aurantiacus TaxID=2851599 RepID=A0A9E2SAC7_9BACT|nr:amidohydrolase family protein [Pinibacter aurantiacus]MBV4357639.1 amidohydrolase family protein [Pinibacter aurantiacus]
MFNPIIDTHIHVWDLDHARYAWLDNEGPMLQRSFNIHEIESDRKELNITKGILVQAADNLEDTGWMLEVACQTDWIAGVVGWLPLQDPLKTEKLLAEKYLSNKYFKGVRHLIHNEPNTQWLLQESVLQSLEILAKHDIAYEIVAVQHEHIETAIAVAKKIPSLRMVFDHLSQPPIDQNEKFGKWGVLMKEAAAHSNFYAKISGLGLAQDNKTRRKAADIGSYVSFVVEQFGEDRVFCGSDWPVSLKAESYKESWQCYRQLIETLFSEAVSKKIFCDNASQFYKLSGL